MPSSALPRTVSFRGTAACRSFIAFGIALSAVLIAFMPATAQAAPAQAVPVSDTAVRANVQDFDYESWDVAYEISVDESGRALAHVTETLTARFPTYDQNRGLVRGIPAKYEGSSTDPRDFRVTDTGGAAIPFEIERDDGFVAVLTGDDSYVHGVQTYVIEYTLSDVVLARDDGTADEFYWDLTDFEHAQRIERFTASISFAPPLESKLNGQMRCYVGAPNSSDECALSGGVSPGSPIEIGPLPLAPREGVTVAVGMTPGAVVQPSARIPSFVRDTLPAILSGVALAVSIAGAIAATVLVRKRRVGRGVIVPQYEVPPELPPLLAGPLVGKSATAVPAELLHLALRGVTRIEEVEGRGGFFSASKPRPRIRMLDIFQAGDPLDAEAAHAIFPTPNSGEVFDVPKQSSSFASSMQKLRARGVSEARQRGYFESAHSPVGRVLGLIALPFALVALALGIFALTQRPSGLSVIAIVIAGLSLIPVIIAIAKHRVHSQAGAETREFLLGARMFIEVAEQQRIEMLQSYRGAERRSDGSADVIHLYEKLLPYAVLFGLEKHWSGVLQTRYEQDPGYVPAWYPAAAVHGMSSFSSTVSQFTGSLSSSVSYSSSSSGGSSGGGFAGGGGGGGFSGGR